MTSAESGYLHHLTEVEVSEHLFENFPWPQNPPEPDGDLDTTLHPDSLVNKDGHADGNDLISGSDSASDSSPTHGYTDGSSTVFESHCAKGTSLISSEGHTDGNTNESGSNHEDVYGNDASLTSAEDLGKEQSLSLAPFTGVLLASPPISPWADDLPADPRPFEDRLSCSLVRTKKLIRACENQTRILQTKNRACGDRKCRLQYQMRPEWRCCTCNSLVNKGEPCNCGHRHCFFVYIVS